MPTQVLLVDDDVGFAQDLLDQLKSEAIEGRHAPDIATATQIVASEVIDVVVLDRRLPDGDGFALCEAIKSSPQTQFIPVIGVSGEADERTRIEAIRAGCDHWLPKPVDVEELVARISALGRTVTSYRAALEKAHTLVAWRDWVRFLVHDLRSPVSVAVANLGLALRNAPIGSGQELTGLIEEARSELLRAVCMLQDILDTDRLQRGLLVPHRSPVDIAALGRTAASHMRILAEARGTAIDLESSGDPHALADPSLLERVLSNLCANAIRYSRKAPVQVDVDGRRPEILEVRVKNDGPAISPEVLSRIFEPWISLGTALSGGGTGLGLAFCRLVIEAHGGRIWIENAKEGEVSFVFSIPRTD